MLLPLKKREEEKFPSSDHAYEMNGLEMDFACELLLLVFGLAYLKK
jgi:hypothetical protein